MYNILHTHLSSSMQQPLACKGGVSSDKVLFTPSEKRSSLEVGFFLELCNLCVTYAQHDSLPKILLLLFYSPKFLEASFFLKCSEFIELQLCVYKYVISHLVSKKINRSEETKLVLLTAKNLVDRLVNKQLICKNIWLITTSVDTLMILPTYI